METDGSTWCTRVRAGARHATVAVLVAMLVAGVVLAELEPAHRVTAAATSEPLDLLDGLNARTDGQLRSSIDPVSGLVTFLGGSAAHPLADGGTGTPEQAARAFVREFGALLGIDADAPASVQPTAAGGSAIRFAQVTRGVPVLAGGVVVRLGPDHRVLSVSGETTAQVLTDPTPSIDRDAAASTARARTAAAEHVATEDLIVDEPELAAYDPSLLGDGAPELSLVWSVAVHDALGAIERRVLVDAHDGPVVLDYGDVAAAKSRRVCDDADNASNPEACASSGPLVARAEGQSATGITDVDLAYDLAGVVYDFYWSVLGRDSIDGNGMALVSTVRYCESPGPADCPGSGAYWNGTQMVYGAGWAGADDIVGHELTHGFTEHTSGLLMYGESGAIAEAMSDVIGEAIDQQSALSGTDPASAAWKIGEQLPGGAIRDMSNPAAFNDPDRMTSSRYAGSIDDSHGVHTNSAVADKAAYLIAAGTANEPSGIFNYQIISGIGLNKTARIFAEANASLLGPGSDYADLFVALPQACTNLIGAGGMTTSDCDQVTKAVTATEMDQAPQTPGARLTAPVCDTGKVVTSHLFTDDMETSSLPQWSRPTPSVASARWTSFAGSSVSGTRSLHAPNMPDATVADATIASGVFVPTGTSTYLWFAHSYAMEADLTSAPYSYYDGGVVEYTTNGGASWADATLLTGTVNGYPGDATIAAASDNPLTGRGAYSGTSAGYQETRIDLTSLAGNSVKVRFRAGTDGVTGWDGWFIDDVSIYTCDPPSAPDAPTSVGAVGSHHAATMT